MKTYSYDNLEECTKWMDENGCVEQECQAYIEGRTISPNGYGCYIILPDEKDIVETCKWTIAEQGYWRSGHDGKILCDPFDLTNMPYCPCCGKKIEITLPDEKEKT